MIRVRDRINSEAGAMDESHGQPFVLGRPLVLPRPGFACWPDDVRRVWLACVRVDRFCLDCGVANCAVHCEHKPCSDECDHKTWRHDYAFCDSEVFETLPLNEKRTAR